METIDSDTDPLSPKFFRRRVYDRYEISRGVFVADLSRHNNSCKEEEVLSFVPSRNFHEIAPLTEPNFFRMFATTATTPNGILGFARQYGFLGFPGMLINLTDRGPVASKYCGERVSDWRDEILAVRSLAAIWDAYKDRDLPNLRRVFRQAREVEGGLLAESFLALTTEPGTWVVRVVNDDQKVCRLIGLASAAVNIQAPSDPWVAAKAMLRQEINKRLHDHCKPFLTGSPTADSDLTLRVGPVTLLGAIWWQLNLLVTGQIRYHPCKICGRQMLVAKQGVGVRTDRAFCSNACKMKDHRAKIKQAKALRSEGRSIAQIAKALGTTTDILRHWLTKVK